MVLPVGNSVVGDAPPSEPVSKPEQYEERPVKGKVWYVLYVEVERPPAGELWLPRFRKRWDFAHTRTEARRIARRLETEGHKVEDVFQGSKMHITEKFKGL